MNLKFPHIVQSMRTAGFTDIYFTDTTAQGMDWDPLLLGSFGEYSTG
jgi:hypothetical protein